MCVRVCMCVYVCVRVCMYTYIGKSCGVVLHPVLLMFGLWFGYIFAALVYKSVAIRKYLLLGRVICSSSAATGRK